jgi:C-methyltransferase C-terminal domain/Putative zinc binding domain/Methyltransferase domain
VKCRHCASSVKQNFLNLGFAPPSNAYLTVEQLNQPEKYYPLRVLVCESCWLVQTEDFADAGELFSNDYAYFSSTSSGWLAHAKTYCDDITTRLSLTSESLVIELASNDGYLLKNFVTAQIPCLGIEPTASTASAAEALGIPVLREFFGEDLAITLASQGKKADLIIGNNVYAHVPDITDFTRGLVAALKPTGTITIEFPHLLQLIGNAQFDTIYHEHFSYFSLYAVVKIFSANGLRVFDIDELPTHGGSLRVYGCHADDKRHDTDRVVSMLERERQAGLRTVDVYEKFQAVADRVKNDLLDFLIHEKRKGRTVVGYGAAAKGNTLLNYAGVKPDLLSFICDAAPSKQGKFMPGSHIPIVAPDMLTKGGVDSILILPWNIADEVIQQTAASMSAKVQYVTAVPKLNML